MKKVTFRGTGQLNGPKSINKVLELDDETAKNLMGQNSDKVILAIMAVHFPGVEVNPRKVGVNVENISKKSQSTEKVNRRDKTKKKFTLTNLILWIVFFPFKLIWWILKKIWKESHV